MRTQNAGVSGGSLPDVLNANCAATDSVGDAVYVTGDKVGARYQVSKVDIDDDSKMPAVGIIIRKDSSTECVVRCGGIQYEYSTGLSPQSILFIDVDATLKSGPPVRPLAGLRWVQIMAHVLSSEDVRVSPGIPLKIRPL